MADAQVASAIANWGPRFTAQGVDPGDFARVTAGIERWVVARRPGGPGNGAVRS